MTMRSSVYLILLVLDELMPRGLSTLRAVAVRHTLMAFTP